MRRWGSALPVVLLAAGGCVATKGDIRLLQDELRVTRAQVAAGDTALLRAGEARRQQVAALSALIDRMNDSLRTLTSRFATFQASAVGEFDAMGRQMVQVQALLGQNTRTVQETRQQLAQLREGASTSAPAAPAPAAGDSTQRAVPGLPGPATLFNAANEALKQGSYRTARTGLDQLLTSYPSWEQVSLAQLHVGDAYKGEGNTAAADSVYQLVVTKYPKSPEAPMALYRHGRILWDANKKAEARVVLNRLIRDFPDADEVDLAKALLRQTP